MTDKKPSQHVDAWRELLAKKLNERIRVDELIEDFEGIDYDEVIDYLYKRGWRDLGNGCSLVKCHARSGEAICILFPLETPGAPGGTTTVCSGPVYRSDDGGKFTRLLKWSLQPMGEVPTRRKRKFGTGRYKIVVELPRNDCPYSFDYQEIDVDQIYDQEFD